MEDEILINPPPPAKLIEALVKAQSEVHNALVDSKNPHYGNDYASLEAVLKAVREPLNKNGLAIVQLPHGGEAGTLGLTTRIYHTSGQWIESKFSAPLQKDNAQGVGSALTYLRRYSIMAMVGIAPTDDDGEGAVTHKGEKKGSAQKEGGKNFPSTGKGAPKQDGYKATEPQRKKLFAMLKSLKATDDEMKNFVYFSAGRSSTAEVTRDEIQEMFRILDTLTEPFMLGDWLRVAEENFVVENSGD